MSSSTLPIGQMPKRWLSVTSILLQFLISLSVLSPNTGAQEPVRPSAAVWDIKSGDRVAWIGGTFTERLQRDGYLETMLAIHGGGAPALHRNLGWSGDTPSGIARAVFGSQEDGFKRLINDTLIAKPTVIVLSYGHAEAFDGAKGVQKFEQDLTRLVSEIQKQSDAMGNGKPRVIYLFPPPRLAIGPGAAGAEAYNKNLELYRAAAKGFCEKSNAGFIDFGPLVVPYVKKVGSVKVSEVISKDGLNYEPFGQWLLAEQAFQLFHFKRTNWRLELDIGATNVTKSEGAALVVAANDRGATMELMDLALPLPTLPRDTPSNLLGLHSADTLVVKGLKEGTYSVQIGDSAKLIDATAERLAKGVSFSRGDYLPQVEELRAAINKKNELFFHRHRPQNETYLFLFRKHEQGNNAVDIPAFDPLIAKEEAKIAELVKPRPYRITIRPAGE